MLIGIDASRAVTRQRTGTEAYAFHLIQALIPLATSQGHRLRLYFNQPPPPDLFPEARGVEQIVIPFPRLWTHIRLAWELGSQPPDLFFTPAHVIPLLYRGVSVATVHDLGYHHFPEAHPRTQLAYLRWSTRHNSRVSRRVVADSQATRADLIQLDGIPADKIDVIYPGLDPALKPVTDPVRLAAVQGKYGIQAPYLLTVGTLQPRKNLVRLVQAYRSSGLPHQLVLAGKAGWLSQPILDEIGRQETASDGDQPSIHLPGFVDDQDKAALLSGATALLFPSLYEGFGFPLLEAQACGTAVLCADGSSLPEIAAGSALLVEPLDTRAMTAAIQRIAADSKLRQKLIGLGFENIQRFNWDDAAARLLQTFARAAA